MTAKINTYTVEHYEITHEQNPKTIFGELRSILANKTINYEDLFGFLIGLDEELYNRETSLYEQVNSYLDLRIRQEITNVRIKLIEGKYSAIYNHFENSLSLYNKHQDSRFLSLCINAKITDNKHLKLLISLLKSHKLPNLVSINLDFYFSLNKNLIRDLIKVLPNTSIQGITLNNVGSDINKRLVSKLAKTLSGMNIRVLAINSITNKPGVQTLIQNIPKSITRFDCYNTELEREPLDDLSGKLKDTNLKVLNLGNNYISEEKVENLVTGLPITITSLSLSNNTIGRRGVEVLSDYIGQTEMVYLDVRRCNLGPYGTEQLVKRTPSTLVSLGMSANQIGTEGLMHLQKLPSSIAHLNLNSIGADPNSIIDFSKFLKTTQLQSLAFCYNNLSNEKIEINTTIKHLSENLPNSLRFLDFCFKLGSVNINLRNLFEAEFFKNLDYFTINCNCTWLINDESNKFTISRPNKRYRFADLFMSSEDISIPESLK